MPGDEKNIEQTIDEAVDLVNDGGDIETTAARRAMGRQTMELTKERMKHEQELERIKAETQRLERESKERLEREKLQSLAQQSNEQKDAETIKRLTYGLWGGIVLNVLQFVLVLALLMRQDIDVNASKTGVDVKTGGAAAPADQMAE